MPRETLSPEDVDPQTEVTQGGEAVAHGLARRSMAAMGLLAILALAILGIFALEAQQSEPVAWIERAKWLTGGLMLVLIIAIERRVIHPMVTRVGRHLHEVRRREQRALQQEEQLRLTLENAPMGIATCHMGGAMLSVNQAWCTTLGYGEVDLVGRSYLDFVHPDDRPESARMLRLASAGEIQVYAREERHLDRDGAPIWGELHAAVAHGPDGLPLITILQFENRSEQVRAQEDLRQHQERLAHVTRLSTMGEMSASIAHEINQPLTAISTYADASLRFLDMPDKSHRVPEVIAKIRQESHRAGEVIRRLRSLAENRDHYREVANLNVVVREAATLAAADARFHNFQLQLHLANEIAPVMIDRIQIQQVLINLIRNGMEAMLSVRSRNAIDLSTQQLNPETVQVTVRDHGIGIAASSDADLFEPFFTTKDSGMGMGLSISRTIIDAHEGRMWHHAAEEGGTAFHFTLPTLTADQAAAKAGR